MRLAPAEEIGEPSRRLVWNGVATDSRESCRVAIDETGVTVTSDITASFGRCLYRMTATSDWQFRTLVVDGPDRQLHVEFDGDRWNVDGRDRPDLAGAMEVDLSVSPFSNTLPVRRLGLAPGESADIVTAYITVPDLLVGPDPQRYTRLTPDEYLYESRDSDFSRIVRVDPDGFVISYPGLFERDEEPLPQSEERSPRR